MRGLKQDLIEQATSDNLSGSRRARTLGETFWSSWDQTYYDVTGFV